MASAVGEGQIRGGRALQDAAASQEEVEMLAVLSGGRQALEPLCPCGPIGGVAGSVAIAIEGLGLDARAPNEIFRVAARARDEACFKAFFRPMGGRGCDL